MSVSNVKHKQLQLSQPMTISDGFHCVTMTLPEKYVILINIAIVKVQGNFNY